VNFNEASICFAGVDEVMSEKIVPRVLLVDISEEACAPLVEALETGGFQVTSAFTSASVLSSIYADPPQCLVMPLNLPATQNMPSLLHQLKGDNIYGHLPVVVFVDPDDLHGMDWETTPADDYVVRPFEGSELVSRVRLCLARAHRDINANPLTGLPGNITIMREAERRLKAKIPFAMAYVDLDNFKAFNDTYGFARGDEVLRMTSRVLVNAINGLGSMETYVGHVGGDDFIFLTPPKLIARGCEEVIQNFDLIVPSFYDDDDRSRNAIHSVDRSGKEQVFPLMGCSIAVVDTSLSEVDYLADISTRAADVKKMAKEVEGSTYVIDRRK
jgi:PleD family two-component response regulator